MIGRVTKAVGTTVIVLFFACIANVKLSWASDTVRICSYNVLNYGAGNDDGRMPMYKSIVQAIKPDVLLCCEVVDNTLGPQFVSQVFTWASFAATPFIDGPDSDNQVFYNQDKFNYIKSSVIATELRNILEVWLEHKPDPGQSPDTLVCYVTHLKASNDVDDSLQRHREVLKLQASVASANYLVCAGDFNFYGPGEPGYQALVNPASGRMFKDPLGTNWVRNTAASALIYTQCTRANNIPGCGGGVTGGMDDRFDFMFMSAPLHQRIIPGSYTAFGNDGLNRLNSSINAPTNTLVSEEIANALQCASDHLPVFADVILGDVRAGVSEDHDALLNARYVNGTIYVSNCKPQQQVTITNVQGRVVYSGTTIATETTIHLPNLAAGTYYVQTEYSRAVFVR